MSLIKTVAAIGVTIFAASSALAHDVHTLDTVTVKAGDVKEISYPVDPTGAPVKVYAPANVFWEFASASPSGETGTLRVKALKSDTCSDIFIFSDKRRLLQPLCAVKEGTFHAPQTSRRQGTDQRSTQRTSAP